MTFLSQHQELVFPLYRLICMVLRLLVNFGIVLESKGCVFQCLLSAVNHIASYVAFVSCYNSNTSLFPYAARVLCMLPHSRSRVVAFLFIAFGMAWCTCCRRSSVYEVRTTGLPEHL